MVILKGGRKESRKNGALGETADWVLPQVEGKGKITGCFGILGTPDHLNGRRSRIGKRGIGGNARGSERGDLKDGWEREARCISQHKSQTVRQFHNKKKSQDV